MDLSFDTLTHFELQVTKKIFKRKEKSYLYKDVSSNFIHTSFFRKSNNWEMDK